MPLSLSPWDISCSIFILTVPASSMFLCFTNCYPLLCATCSCTLWNSYYWRKRGSICLWKQCLDQVCLKINSFCSIIHSCILSEWPQWFQISYSLWSLQWQICVSTEQNTEELALQFTQGCCPASCHNQRALQLLVCHGVAWALLSKFQSVEEALCWSHLELVPGQPPAAQPAQPRHACRLKSSICKSLTTSPCTVP